MQRKQGYSYLCNERLLLLFSCPRASFREDSRQLAFLRDVSPSAAHSDTKQSIESIKIWAILTIPIKLCAKKTISEVIFFKELRNFSIIETT